MECFPNAVGPLLAPEINSDPDGSRTRHYIVAELPIGNFLVRLLAPSRINRRGRIPVQTMAVRFRVADVAAAIERMRVGYPDYLFDASYLDIFTILASDESYT